MIMNFSDWLLLEGSNIYLISWNSFGDISFLVNGVRYDYSGADGGMLRYLVSKYRLAPGRLLNMVKKLNLPFVKHVVEYTNQEKKDILAVKDAGRQDYEGQTGTPPYPTPLMKK